MNPFKSRRKAKEGASTRDEVAVVPSLAKAFKKNKKSEQQQPPPPEEKPPQFDLANALPSTDDFRTSLLMPKLSARFSMLREADDPSSLIGKANDDSVLFPRRASRLNLFNGISSDLADIAELAHHHGAPETPKDHTEGDEDDHAGSIMDRPRPKEGNTLFAGRQKTYKIPIKTKAQQDKELEDLKSKGNDCDMKQPSTDNHVPVSEKTQHEGSESLAPNSETDIPKQEQQEDTPPHRAFTDDLGSSIPAPGNNEAHLSLPSHASFDQQAATTAGSQSRASDATTAGSSNANLPLSSPHPSVSSMSTNDEPAPREPLQDDRGVSAQTVRQNQSDSAGGAKPLEGAVSDRLDTLHRSSTSSKSTNHPHQGHIPEHPSVPRRAASNASPLNNCGTRHAKAVNNDLLASSSHPRKNPLRALSPNIVKYAADGTPLVAALNPEDRGKATALGLFNKPNGKAFDEDEYMRLQLQLYEARNTPMSQRSCSGNSSLGSADVSSIKEDTPPGSARASGGSITSSRQLSAKASKTSLEQVKPDTPELAPAPLQPRQPSAHMEASSDIETPQLSRSNTVESGMSGNASNGHDSRQHFPHGIELDAIAEAPGNDTVQEVVSHYEDNGHPPKHLGLSHLVKSQLRPESQVSIMSEAPMSPPRRTGGRDPLLGAAGANNREQWEASQGMTTEHSISNEKRKASGGTVPPRPVKIPQTSSSATNLASPLCSPTATDVSSDISQRAKQILGQANALRGANFGSNDSHDGLRGRYAREEAPAEHTESEQQSAPPRTWQEEIEMSGIKHNRKGSTRSDDTEIEREDLAQELAERRKLLEEKMRRNAVMDQSRTSSPNTGDRPGESKAASGFSSLLKSRSRPPPGASREGSPHRAMRFFNNNVSSASVGREDGRKARSRSPHLVTSALRHASRPAPRGTQDIVPPLSARNRSGSEAPHSKFQRHRANEHDMCSSSRVANSSPHVPMPSTRPSVESLPKSDHRTFSNESRPNTPRRLASPPPPPNVLPPDPPSGVTSPRPAPLAPPFAANTTPPLNDTLTPVGPSSPDSVGSAAQPKRINKSKISEPVLVSTSNQAPTVGLPPPPPGIPPMSSRRRRPTVNILSGLISGGGGNGTGDMSPSSSSHAANATMNQQVGDENSAAIPRQQRMHKESSESMGSRPRSRTATLSNPSRPRSPVFPPSYTPVIDESLSGGMF